MPPSREEFTRLLGPIRLMAESGANIRASVVYLDKHQYNGRYLRCGGPRGSDPLKFRNYILRRLLEFHFQRYELLSEHYDLVLDRVTMTTQKMGELRNNLVRNRNIPTPTYITHASSIYVEGLQVVHHIANGFQNSVTGPHLPPELSFVNARDITIKQRIS